jgi:hypothetical protein
MRSEKVVKRLPEHLPEGFEKNHKKVSYDGQPKGIDFEEFRPTSRRMNSDVTGYGWSAVQGFV